MRGEWHSTSIATLAASAAETLELRGEWHSVPFVVSRLRAAETLDLRWGVARGGVLFGRHGAAETVDLRGEWHNLFYTMDGLLAAETLELRGEWHRTRTEINPAEARRGPGDGGVWSGWGCGLTGGS